MNAKRRFESIVVLLLAGGMSTTSCAGAQAGPERPDPAGEYVLVSVDGLSVPADVADHGIELRVVSGVISLGADGTCTSRTVFQPPAGAEIAREVRATYTMAGDSLTLRWDGAGTTVGVFQGDTFTMDNAGMVFVYELRR